MKRKDDAEERKAAEKEQQKAAERTHWTLGEESSLTGVSVPKLKFIVEYDSTGQGLLNQPSGAIGRKSYRNYNKDLEPPTKIPSKAATGPVYKMAKLADKPVSAEKSKNKNK